MDPHFVIEKQLTPEHIQSFRDIGQTLPAVGASLGYNTEDALKIGITNEKNMPEEMLNRVYNSIKSIVEKKTGIMYPTYGVFSESVTPMKEHVDIDKSQIDYDKDPAYTIIIPLSTNIECHTVVWNAIKKEEEKGIDPGNILTFENPPHTYTLLEEQALSHCWVDEVKKWGKPYMYEHSAGNIICFKRKYIHASGLATSGEPVSNSSFKQDSTKQFILILTRLTH